jgi:hypothetical protein
MKGSQESLTTVVVKDAANWLTPQSGDVTGSTQEAVMMWANGKRPKTSDQRLRTQVAAEELKHGQAAPANPSTDGSRQGLWRTPKANEPQEDWQKVAERRERMRQAGDTKTGDLLSLGQQAQKLQWATPRSGKTTDENPETWALRQAKGDVATMPLTAQVKAWATPKASDPQHSGPNMRDSAGNYALPAQAVRAQWATPIQGDSHLASTLEVAQKRIEERKVTLSRQNPGKLNPRWVETLMGLPVGWTMPSCASPQTIAPTNSDSWATESCQPPQRELFEF